jgi:hypothetical protein
MQVVVYWAFIAVLTDWCDEADLDFMILTSPHDSVSLERSSDWAINFLESGQVKASTGRGASNLNAEFFHAPLNRIQISSPPERCSRLRPGAPAWLLRRKQTNVPAVGHKVMLAAELKCHVCGGHSVALGLAGLYSNWDPIGRGLMYDTHTLFLKKAVLSWHG